MSALVSSLSWLCSSLLLLLLMLPWQMSHLHHLYEAEYPRKPPTQEPELLPHEPALLHKRPTRTGKGPPT